MSALTETARETALEPWAMRRYLIVLGGLFPIVVLLVSGWVFPFCGCVVPDYYSQIARPGDVNWYRDFGGRQIPQIQDQDIFYSNIGSSVASAKAADIVFLGPSFVSYAVDRDTLRSSPVLGQLKIYNMAFVGLRGGEFSRKVITRWHIRAPLWIINVDDQFVHFFSDDLNVTLGPMKMPIDAVGRNRIKGYLTVAGRNERWRIEDLTAAIEDGHFSQSGLYRNISNGDMALEVNPAYLANDNKLLRLARDPNCDTNPDVVSYATAFLNEIGGHVVFILVPHSQACVRQAAELARALNVELIAPPVEGLTTLDGGGHLDKKGAEKFTSYLAAEVVKTDAFKRAFAAKLGSR
jgi:hypothetical protein